jgi:hypothetical protein
MFINPAHRRSSAAWAALAATESPAKPSLMPTASPTASRREADLNPTPKKEPAEAANAEHEAANP